MMRGGEREQTRRAFLRAVARTAGALAGVGLLAGCSPAAGTAPPRVYRVGLLTPAELEPQSNADFWGRLTELGYREGHNLVKLERGGTSDPTLADEHLSEMVRLPVGVIVARGNASIRPAAAATSSIPIVLLGGTNPVDLGVVESFARPGGNVTGITEAPAETVDQKRMQLLVEAAPAISRVIVAGGGVGGGPRRRLEEAATSLGVGLVILPPDPSALEPSLRSAIADGANGLLVRQGGASTGNTGLIRSLAEEYRLPVIYPTRAQVTGGGLMTYATRPSETDRRAAEFVDRILRGARPADLPVEYPTRYDLIVNMRTARAIGLTFPSTFVVQIDEVIE